PFVGIKAPDAFKQTLAAQDFVAASDAPLKAIRRVEKRAVAIGHAAVQRKEVFRGGPGRGRGLATPEYLDRGADPDRPVPEQPTAKTHDDALPSPLRYERCQEIEHDMVVVAGVERDTFLSFRGDDTANDIEGGVAVERRDLDRDHIVDRRETSPEPAAECDAAHGRLQVETDQRHFASNSDAMLDQLVLRRALHCGEA